MNLRVDVKEGNPWGKKGFKEKKGKLVTGRSFVQQIYLREDWEKIERINPGGRILCLPVR